MEPPRQMVICRRFLDLIVLSAALIHLTFGCDGRNSTSLSFMALERSSEDGISGIPPTMSSN